MVITIVPLLVAVVGVLTYALSSNGKVSEIGKLLFWTSWLVVMLSVAGKTVHLG